MPQNRSDKDDERSGLRLFGYIAGVIAIVCGIWGIIDAVNSVSKDQYNVTEYEKSTYSIDELRSMYLWTLILFVIPFILSAITLMFGIHRNEPILLWPFMVLVVVQAVLAILAIVDDLKWCTVTLAFLRASICVTAAYFINRLRLKMIEDKKELNYNYLST